jgi:spermidine synthase
VSPLLCFLAIAAAGFAASVAQIVVLRELLVLFSGNELSTGLIFASWLLWTAAGSGIGAPLCRRAHQPYLYIPVPLSLLSLLLPATILWIRASRIVWSIPRGETVSLALMLGISVASTSLFCLVSGYLFALTWSAYVKMSEARGVHPTTVYLGEALGAALGGIVFYFVLIPRATALVSALVISLFLLLVAAVLIQNNIRGMRKGWSSVMPWLAILVLVTTGLISSLRLDRISRQWEWGPELVSVRDTPFHNLALLKKENQFTLFANGLWLFSLPDPQTAEYAVHLALLEHPNPRRVLMIGGGVGGLIAEALKDRSIRSLDYVEPDPDLIRMAQDYLPTAVTEPLLDKRVHVFNVDAASYVRSSAGAYDVVLLNMGDPLNAETNRFYTVEFFRRIAAHLNPGGIFSLGVSSSPDIIGANQARFLRSVYVTLGSVFPEVLAIPGSTARFLAAFRSEDLTADPNLLITRISARKLQLDFMREYYLFDYMSPMRLEYLSAILVKGGGTEVNRDFAPTCYFNSLIVWSEQIQPRMGKMLLRLLDVSQLWLWGGLTALILCMVGVLRVSGVGPGAGVSLCVTVVGGAQMVIEIALLLAFQILEGFVYTELALIISFFMAGTALGAAAAGRLSGRMVRPRLWLAVVQGALSVYLITVLALFHVLQHAGTAAQAKPPMTVIFSLSALIAGILGGLHFALAVKSTSGPGTPSVTTGAGLYGLDLAGAAAGALLATLFLIPVYGLPRTLVALSLLTLGSALALLKPAAQRAIGPP